MLTKIKWKFLGNSQHWKSKGGRFRIAPHQMGNRLTLTDETKGLEDRFTIHDLVPEAKAKAVSILEKEESRDVGPTDST